MNAHTIEIFKEKKRNVQRRTGMKVCLPVFAEQTSLARLKIHQHFPMIDNSQVTQKQELPIKL